MARRLSAILAADVVNYSKLMSENESDTLAALKVHRNEVFDPNVSQYGGRIVKLMGDGALVDFPSVVDAVQCALAIQKAITEDWRSTHHCCALVSISVMSSLKAMTSMAMA